MGFDYTVVGPPTLPAPSSPATCYDKQNDVLYCSTPANPTIPTTWSPINGYAGANPQTGNYAAQISDNAHLLIFNIGGTPATLTLLNPPPSATWAVWVQNNGTANLTVSGNGLTINAPTGISPIAGGAGALIYTDGKNYFAILSGSGGGGTGPQGPQGFTGAQGFQGPAGVGTQGPQGTQGSTGAQGPQGFQGFQGPAGGGGGSTPWSSLTNATGNLALANGTNNTTFDQTSGGAQWAWGNTTAATSSTPQSSPNIALEGTWYGPSLASAVDGWTIQNVPGNSTTMPAGKVATASETSGVVTLSGTGMTVFPVVQAGYTGVGAWVIFQGFTTLTWLNGQPVLLITNTSSSITFNDPTNHGNHGSVAETGVTASSAQSSLTISQIPGSAPVGVIQLLNSNTATEETNNTSPAIKFANNYWNGSASAQETWNIYSSGIFSGQGSPSSASSLFISHVGDTANSGSIVLAGNGPSAQNSPNVGWYNINNGIPQNIGFIGVEPDDGVLITEFYAMQVQEAGISAGVVGNCANLAGADIAIGGFNHRTNVTGPNYGIVLGGVGGGAGGTQQGYGSVTFSPASGSCANYGVLTGTQFDPTTGTASFIGLYVNPTIRGTSSGNTTAFVVNPVLTAGSLTGTNLIASFQSNATHELDINYSGVITTYGGVATAGNGVPSEVNQIAATGLTANYNAGSAKTIFTPTAASQLRISFSQAITTADAVSSTFPSLTLGWTDVGGIARTKTLVATSATNTTAVESDGVAVITTNTSTAVTVTSASYASNTPATMTYALSVTTEVL